MAVTNPDSLLDKNGLAYYHSKVKDMIRDATKVNVNVIQSEHQRIGYSIESNNYGLQPVTEVQSGEIYYNSNWGEWVEGYIENGSFVNGSNVKILFAPEDGYSCGNLVLNLDGRALIEDEDYEVNHQYQAGKYNYYEVYIFVAYGGFLTISATPATVKPTRTITLHANPPYVDDFVYEGESNGTYCYNNTTWTGENIYFNKSNDVTVTAYDGDQLRFQRVGNSYYNQTLTKSDSSALSYSGSGSNRYYYYNVNGSNETITLNLIHSGRTVGFYLHPSSSAGSFITGVNFVVNYSYVDSNTGQTITDTQTVTNGKVQFNLPYASTGTYTVTLPSGYQLSGNSSPSLTGQLSDNNSDYHFFVTQS